MGARDPDNVSISSEKPDLSIVVIGYNEAALLPACLESVRAAGLDGISHELIYVDGGSSDSSVADAQSAGVDQLLTSEGQCRAAANRNRGWKVARGRYVQFVDGDMVLDRDWPGAAVALLDARPEVAVVFGRLRERNTSPFYQAMQIDWEYPEGEAQFCGGAALFRRSVLEALGGFPEDLAFGEEPYLCWRIRNELGNTVYHLHRPMADHDLAFNGFRDYWRRNLRCGQAFAEVAARCAGAEEPLWREEVRGNLAWGAVLILLLLTSVGGAAALLAGTGGLAAQTCLAAGLLLISVLLLRKALQFVAQGRPAVVALLYAIHTYAAKLGIALGILRWRVLRR